MTTFLPKSLQQDIESARIAALKKASRLRVQADGREHPVLRLWSNGFAVETGVVPTLRGLVDLYDGAKQISQCLIIASEEDAGEMRYEFKRATGVTDRAPLDFYRAPYAPVALLGKD
ncbi:hypothetical protein [Aestuariivita sp.]|jgi:hypothetical protein|uniref:hypothetical protein n=1 Tax=Aestuariivita sp. TaxID=1872407 RepID=UPI00216D554B|nr:hypothetical protein [Aestuariivita sp.]MCE8007316.1 hypothetical protein [Aestuariivita sp.]